jgi:asparagine synthetase B (glutamine-hydrolysing)
VSQYAALIGARLHTRSALAGYGASAFWWTAPALGVDPRAFTLWDDQDRRGLYTRGFAWHVREWDPLSRLRDLLTARPADDAIGRALYLAARTTLPDSRLAMADRLSIAAGVALHLPYLDRDVIELAYRLRPDQSRGRRMDPIAAVLARRLPESLMPTSALARHRSARSTQLPWLPVALQALVPAVLLARRFDGRGIVSRPVVRQLWEDHSAGRADHSHHFWSLLMLEFWFREYIDGDTAADEPFEYAILRAA